MPRLFSAKVIFYIILLIACDLSLAPIFQIGQARFILSYLFICYAAFTWGWQRTIPVALMVGLLRDLLTTVSLGLEVCSLFVAAICLDWLIQKMQREIIILRIFLTFIFVLTATTCHYFLFLFFGQLQGNYVHFFSTAAASALYTAVLGPFLFWVSSRWFRDSRVGMRQYDLFSSR